VACPAGLPFPHTVHGELCTTLFHGKQLGVAVGAFCSLRKVFGVLEGDLARRVGVRGEDDRRRPRGRGRLSGRRRRPEVVALRAGRARIVLRPVPVAGQTPISPLDRPRVRGMARDAARVLVRRLLVQAPPRVVGGAARQCFSCCSWRWHSCTAWQPSGRRRDLTPRQVAGFIGPRCGRYRTDFRVLLPASRMRERGRRLARRKPPCGAPGSHGRPHSRSG
jgi:hypothetical protein